MPQHRDPLLGVPVRSRRFDAEGGSMSREDWLEHVATLSIDPDQATRDDVAQMAAELMEARAAIHEVLNSLRFAETRSASRRGRT